MSCKFSLPLIFALLGGLSATHAAQIERFSPQGTTKTVRQASVRFDADMVPLGDPALAEPMRTDCPVSGKGRWVDSRNWVYDFAHDLPGGLACSFTTLAGMRALDGTPLSPASFAFDTGGPAIVTSVPTDTDEQISEEQVFVLGLDSNVNESSLAGRAWCVAEGVAEKIPLQWLKGKEKRRVLLSSRDFFAVYASSIELPRNPLIQSASRLADPRQAWVDAAMQPGSAVQVARCARRLPASAKVSLVWESGIESARGVTTQAAQTLQFRTRGDFTARLSCQKLKARAPCLPVLPMSLDFSAPVAVKHASAITLATAPGSLPARSWKAQIAPGDLRAGVTQSVTFNAPFPEGARLQLNLPSGLRDDAGRRLVNARRFPMAVLTDMSPPLAKFAAGFGIYELNAQPMLPLALRYVDPLDKSHARLAAAQLVSQNPGEIIDWMRRMREADNDLYETDAKTGKTGITRYGAETSIFEPRHKIQRTPLPKPLPDQDTEVIGIPLTGAGFHMVEVASPRLGFALMDKRKPYHARAAALVTNLALHFKHGEASSLVWVTRLDNGTPVSGAEVAVRDCSGKVHAQGKTGADGLWRIPHGLPDVEKLPGCLDQYDRQFMVTAHIADDFSFLLSNWGEGISPWRFNLFQNHWQGPDLAHAVFDRSLFRAGEEVGMKLYFRRKKADGFAIPDKAGLLPQVLLRHQGSGEETRLAVRWDHQGTSEATTRLAQEAKHGSYDVYVLRKGASTQPEELLAGTFRVAAFRIPTLRARLSGPTQAVRAQQIDLDIQADYLAGGAASHLPVTLRGLVQAYSVRFDEHEQATFANGRVRTGRLAQQADWQFIGSDAGDDSLPADTDASGNQPLKTLHLRLDQAGTGRAGWRGLPQSDTPRLLLAEAEYRDANGEIRNAVTRIPLFPAQIVLGVQPDSWIQARDRQRFRIIALTPDGRPQAGVAVKGRLYQRHWYSYRKRIIGGFYAYEHGEEIKSLPAECQGVTDAKGMAFCETRANAMGDLLFEAQAQDREGNPAYAHQDFWVPEGDGWINASDNDRMDLIPERRRYEPGETAQLRLRMPFEEASVLVSVEREGVLDAWTQTVKRDNPVIRVPVKPEYGPNVFISAFAVRGRVAGVKPGAMIDLGKPAFRMGVAEIQTGWSGHALEVKLDTDKVQYRTREKVKLRIQVRRPDGSVPKQAEVALAAVDEGLLALAPNTSWKLLDAMMQRRGIAVTTSTAQMQVVGKRHYGRKAVAAGGGGGSGAVRELFDTRIFWQARVALDTNGEAQVDIPLNDSLTQFRIVAVAHAGAARFGSGETRVAVTQDLQLLAGAAPLVRVGDSLKTYFTLRNISHRNMTVDLAATLNGVALAPRSESLQAGEGREIGLPVTVPAGSDKLVWSLTASERGGEGASDRLRMTQSVREAVPVRTLQATLLQLDSPHVIPVQTPARAQPGRGGLAVTLQAGLAGDSSGVHEYFRHYPWTCLEQRTSSAVALGDTARWQAIADILPAYLDDDGLAKYWPDLREGSDTLTAYLLAITHEAGLKLPESAQQRMLDGLRRFIEGRVTRGLVLNTADLAIRKLAAMEALSRYPDQTIDPAWLDSFSLTPERWPTSALIDWINLLTRNASLPSRDAHLAQARAVLASRLNFSGTHLGFSSERNDAWWWLMTNADVNANRLLLSAMEGGTHSPADLGRLMRGTLARQQGGHWSTTVANAWGVLAARRFAARMEATAPTGSTQASVGARHISHDWGKAPNGGSHLLDWPAHPTQLKLEHLGAGQPWVSLVSQAAIPLTTARNAGYSITRSVTPVSQRHAGTWQRGDVMRVRLDIDAQTDMGWVAVLDPIPAGASILGTGLGGDSALLTASEKGPGGVYPAYEERTHDSYRAYYAQVPKGRFSLEYTLRLNNEGRFNLPPARVEAMYVPELHGELPLAEVVVAP